MIEVQGLTKHYGQKKALDNVSFSIQRGEVVGFLGLNGAGKSTTMNILTGYISATSGLVRIDGHDIVRQPNEAKRVMGYFPEQLAFYHDMRVIEFLRFVAELKRMPAKNIAAHVEDICQKVGIAHITGRMIRNLSKGYRQRVGLAQALIGDPKVLILDEPTVGLDPSQIVEIRALIKSMGKSSTVIVSSHILSEIEAICERVIVLYEGRIIADATPGSLAYTVRAPNLLFARIAGEPERVLAALGPLQGIKSVQEIGEKEPGTKEYRIESEAGGDVRAGMFRALAKADLPLLQTYAHELSLEDAFLTLIHSQARENGRVS